MKKSEWLDCQGNEFFPKTKGDSITGQDREQKHCDFRFSQIEKKNLKSQFCNYANTCTVLLRSFTEEAINHCEPESIS